jgi:23S rRNA pseudouridine1911/1915/1917 synthase
MKFPILHFISEKPVWASEIALSQFGIPLEIFQELLPRGAVYLNKKRLQNDVLLQPNDYLRLHPMPKRFPSLEENWRERILFESSDYLVFEKPAGMPVHASLDNVQENVLRQLSDRLGKPLLVTHRLDVPVSGCLVFAKSEAAQMRFNNALLKGRVEKHYRCLVGRDIRPQRLVHYMEKNRRVPKILLAQEAPGLQRCELEILHSSPNPLGYELALRLLTGRTHQIRAQLSASAAPILGDVMYGGREESGFSSTRIALQAFALKFLDLFSVELPSPWAKR